MTILFLMLVLAGKGVQNSMALNARAPSGTTETLHKCADILRTLELDDSDYIGYIASHSGGFGR